MGFAIVGAISNREIRLFHKGEAWPRKPLRTARRVEGRAKGTAHQLFAGIHMKRVHTSAECPIAGVSCQRVPPGYVVGWQHDVELVVTESVLAGGSELSLGGQETALAAGYIVAVPSKEESYGCC